MKKEKIQGKTLAEPAKKEGVAAVNRALQILGAFESSEDGLTLSMLAVDTGLYESTILRLLDSLILAGFVKRLTDGRSVVGPRVYILSVMYRRSFSLADSGLTLLLQLVSVSGEAAGWYGRASEHRLVLNNEQNTK